MRVRRFSKKKHDMAIDGNYSSDNMITMHIMNLDFSLMKSLRLHRCLRRMLSSPKCRKCWWQFRILVSDLAIHPHSTALTSREHLQQTSKEDFSNKLRHQQVREVQAKFTNILVTDVGDEVCWSHVWEVDDNYSRFSHQQPLYLNISDGWTPGIQKYQ